MMQFLSIFISMSPQQQHVLADSDYRITWIIITIESNRCRKGKKDKCHSFFRNRKDQK